MNDVDGATGLTRLTVRTDGAELAVWHRPGSDQGPWVVFVPGAGLDHRMFLDQVEAFDEDTHLLLPDMRGQGESTLDPGHRATLDTLVDDVVTLLDRFAVRRASLVGQSFGGNVVQEVAHRHPGRVDRIAMIGSPGQHRPVRRGEAFTLSVFSKLYRLVPWTWFAAYSGRWSSSVPATRAYVRECLVTTGRDTWVDLGTSGFRALCPLETLPEARTLLLRGEHEMPAVMDGIFDEIERHRPDTTVRAVVPDAGHQSPQDNPAEVNRHLAAFLTS